MLTLHRVKKSGERVLPYDVQLEYELGTDEDVNKRNAWLDGRRAQEERSHRPVNNEVPAEGEFSDFQPNAGETIKQSLLSRQRNNAWLESRPTPIATLNGAAEGVIPVVQPNVEETVQQPEVPVKDDVLRSDTREN